MDLLSQMATFVRIVETGSLSAAARAQRLSVPAVSRQLRALEDDLGAALVLRTTRKLKITQAGQNWYAHCTRILRDVDSARAVVSVARAARGLLTVSAPVSLGLAHVAPHMPALLKRHRGLTVDLRLEDHLVEPVTDAVDVVVRGAMQPPDSASLVAQPLLSFHRFVVAAPAYLRRHGEPREPAALARHECLVQLGGAGPLSTWRLFRDGEEQAVPVRGALRISAPLAIRDAALAGLGVAFLPDWLVDTELAAGRLQRVLAAFTSGAITAWALYRAELRSSPRVRAFVDEIRSPRPV
jgi:DNA-binding transcriptional LysR family regulator